MHLPVSLVVALLEPKNPGPHAVPMQAAWPAFAWYIPPTHNEHAPAPAAPEYFPAGHALQLPICPNSPAVQFTQELWPVAVVCFPAGQ